MPDVKTYPCFKAGFSLWWLFVTVASSLLFGCAEVPLAGVSVRIASGPPYAANLEPVQQHVQPTKTNVYRVQPGDTLWAIAVAHTVDLEDLAARNGISNPDQLFVGQALQIRGTANLASVSTPPSSPSLPNLPPLPIISEVSIQPMEKSVVPAIPLPIPVKNVDVPPPLPPVNSHSREEGGLKVSKNAWVIHAGTPKEWLWPLEGRIVESFGIKGNRRNTGIDIATSLGASVRATADGVVAFSDDALASYGNLILLRHGGSFMSAYAHNDKLLVKRGDLVRAGEVIALAGTSGRAESPRLHFELRKNLTPLNPMQYLPKRQTKRKRSLSSGRKQ